MANKEVPPTIVVVFGITGDLSHRYLLPALSEIIKVEHMAKKIRILGVSRQAISVKEALNGKERNLASHTQTFQMDYSNPKDYGRLKAKIKEIDALFNDKAQIIYYFAVPPASVPGIIKLMGQSGLNSPNTKLLLEKPFGTDFKSAEKLIKDTARHYPEKQIYRIDHYLAKEMAQNITVFLGSNTIFRDVWGGEFIESIEVTAAEKISIEGRVNFYEGTGALRDYQSHLLQLAALVLMEPCTNIFDFEEIPRRRLAALEALKPVDPARAIRGQYSGYMREAGNPNSTTETFVDMKLFSSDPRWKGVPVRLTTGKCLDAKLTQVTVRFKQATPDAANVLIIRIQPREGFELDLWVKEPGYERQLQKLHMYFSYDAHFKRLPDAYEQVLVDAMHSNHSLFTGSGEVLASWRVLQPIIDQWRGNTKGMRLYKKGSSIEEVVAQKSS